MDFSRFNWDDLRFVLAVERGASLSAAARRLGVTHSTVFRRLNAMEQDLGVRLFERQPSGYQATAAGSELAAAAERVETEVLDSGRRLAGRDLALSGTLRLTAPDDMVDRLLMPVFADFQTRYPKITLEVSIDNRMFNLTRREADVAVRPTTAPPETLVGRRVGAVAMTVYAHRDLDSDWDTDGPVALDQLPWVAWDESSDPRSDLKWLHRHADDERIVYRSNSFLNLCSACAQGLGAALLPCFLGDSEPALKRLRPPIADLGTELWLLTHPDLRRAARVRALLDLLFENLKPLAPRLAGQS